jgi:hypothetical protein
MIFTITYYFGMAFMVYFTIISKDLNKYLDLIYAVFLIASSILKYLLVCPGLPVNRIFYRSIESIVQNLGRITTHIT